MGREPTENPPAASRTGQTLLLLCLSLVAVLLAVWAARRYVPGSWTSARHLGQLLRSLNDHPLGPFYTTSMYAVLASAFVPITALIATFTLLARQLRALALSPTPGHVAIAVAVGLALLGASLMLTRLVRRRQHTVHARSQEHEPS